MTQICILFCPDNNVTCSELLLVAELSDQCHGLAPFPQSHFISFFIFHSVSMAHSDLCLFGKCVCLPGGPDDTDGMLLAQETFHHWWRVCLKLWFDHYQPEYNHPGCSSPEGTSVWHMNQINGNFLLFLSALCLAII